MMSALDAYDFLYQTTPGPCEWTSSFLFRLLKKTVRVWLRPASPSIFARFGRAQAMIHYPGYVHLPSPLPNVHCVFASLSLPLPNAQKVLTYSSSIVRHEFVSSCLIPFQHNAVLHNPALHSSGTLIMIQAPLSLVFSLYDLLHHFVVSMQTIACACSMAHLLPYCVTTLLRHG